MREELPLLLMQQAPALPWPHEVMQMRRHAFPQCKRPVIINGMPAQKAEVGSQKAPSKLN
jgi:hypothetical protein